MPRLSLPVCLFLTSNFKADSLGACLVSATKTSGSCSEWRIQQATNAGKMPRANMPRQPISGSSIGVTTTAASTPVCQPSAT